MGLLGLGSARLRPLGLAMAAAPDADADAGQQGAADGESAAADFSGRRADAADEDLLAEALRGVLPARPHQMALLAMLQALDEAFVRAGVTYWVTGGTLLGAMRHGGFIPHDDDVDIEVPASDLPRAAEALGAVGRSFRGLGEWQAATCYRNQ